MLKAETTKTGTEAQVNGKGINILMEFTALCASILETGMPAEGLIMAISVGQEMVKENKRQSEDEKLTAEFVEELMRRVKEKRDAQANESNVNS